MSFAPLKSTLEASAAVTALIGSNPIRLRPAGKARQGEALPYVTYQQVTGSPENYLGSTPDADTSTTQIDIYGETVADAHAVFTAIRNAVEPVAYVVAVREMGRDPQTNHVRVSMDVDWITSR